VLRLELVPLRALAQELAVAPHGLGLLARPSLGRLLVMPPHPHLAVEALALHLLLQGAQRLIDIVVANLNLDDDSYSRAGENGTTDPVPSIEGWRRPSTDFQPRQPWPQVPARTMGQS